MKVVCLVDNSVRPLSAFWGEHGLAFWIESGNETMLFDTGASGTVLLHNLELAGLSANGLKALALSHSHPDHTGGLPALLEQRDALPIYAHPDLFRPRYSKQGGEAQPKWLPMSPEELKHESEMHLSDAPQFIIEGVWTTGEILDRSEPEGRSPHHVVRSGEDWIADPYRDDMSLVLETKAGLYLVCGCCHAGLLNTLSHVRRMFGKDPVGILGGTHLVGADRDRLEYTVKHLRDMGSPALHLNHCTGQPAFVAMSLAFGDRVAHCPAGTVLEI